MPTISRSTSTAPRGGRPVGQHDRLGGADHHKPTGIRRLDAGREVTAAEPRQGDAGAAGAAAEQQIAEQQAQIASERKSQVGSGQRAEKVRTYNFPQGRVTDPPDQAHLAQSRGRPERRARRVHERLSAEEKRRRLEDAQDVSGVADTTPGAASVADALTAATDGLARDGIRTRASMPNCLLAAATGGDGRA